MALTWTKEFVGHGDRRLDSKKCFADGPKTFTGIRICGKKNKSKGWLKFITNCCEKHDRGADFKENTMSLVLDIWST